MAALETLKVQVADRIARVALNRPEVRNAFHPTMIRELTEVFTDLASRTDISVVVLSGEGKSFCSGADLGYMQSMAKFDFAENERDAQSLHAMFWALRECPHPIVGRLHGHVMGGALGLAAVCDVAAAFASTQFCFSEVKLGLAPAVISPFVLEKMQPSHARRYMLTGEVFTAPAALAAGLVHFAGSGEEVDLFIDQIVNVIRHSGPEATRATKKLLRSVEALSDWQQKREITTRAIAERRVSTEGQEGLRGFLEKREPAWRYPDKGTQS